MGDGDNDRFGHVTTFPELVAGADGDPLGQAALHSADAQGFATDDGAPGASEPAPFHVPSEQCHIYHVAAEQRVESIAYDGDRADGRVEQRIRHHSRDQPLGGAQAPRLPDQAGGDQT